MINYVSPVVEFLSDRIHCPLVIESFHASLPIVNRGGGGISEFLGDYRLLDSYWQLSHYRWKLSRIDATPFTHAVEMDGFVGKVL